jgi:undecaprenyl pyrophosphate phosphatase UppP
VTPRITKEQTVTVSIATLCACFVALLTAYPVARSVLAEEVSDQIQPLTKAFIVTTTTTVRNLRNQISAMVYKQDQCVGVSQCWTVLDQVNIDATRADLAAAESALESLEDT